MWYIAETEISGISRCSMVYMIYEHETEQY
jgi:hypothetical protein